MNTTRTDDLLAGPAIEDAGRFTPAFSETLHARVMDRLTAARTNVVAPASRMRMGAWLLPAGLAAAVLLGILIVYRSMLGTNPTRVVIGPGPHPDRKLVHVPALQVFLSSLTDREAALEADLGPGNWAGLDHDARAAVQSILQPISGYARAESRPSAN